MTWILKTPRGTLTYPTKARALVAKNRLGEGGTIHEEPELTGTETGRTSSRRPVLSHPKPLTIRTTEGDVPLRNLRQTNCPHESWDRRDAFSQSKGRTHYWCAGCGGGIEYRRHPVSGVLLELVVGG